MTREEFYNSERHEDIFYKIATIEQELPVPLTRKGFEALCQRIGSFGDLIIDDPVRSIIAGFIHHIPSDENTFVLERLWKIVHKSISCNLTFAIDQEMKAKAVAAAEAKKKEMQENNVLPMKKEDNGPQTAG